MTSESQETQPGDQTAPKPPTQEDLNKLRSIYDKRLSEMEKHQSDLKRERDELADRLAVLETPEEERPTKATQLKSARDLQKIQDEAAHLRQRQALVDRATELAGKFSPFGVQLGNLLTLESAEAMLEHCVDAARKVSSPTPPVSGDTRVQVVQKELSWKTVAEAEAAYLRGEATSGDVRKARATLPFR